MGTTFTPAETFSPFAMLAPGVRAEPGASERRQAALLQLTLQNPTPAQWGAWGGDKYEQTNHYLGVIGLAIKPYLNATRAAKVSVLRRRKPARDGFISKAVGHGHYARDEEYEPVDPDHELCRIVAQPNGARGKWSMARELTFLTLQYMLTGDAPAWAPFNAAGKPVQFYALTSATTQLQFGPGQNPMYPKGAYRVLPGYGQQSFGLANGMYSGALLPAEEVHRLTDEDPYIRGAGRSRLAVGAKEIDVLEAITKSRWSFFTDGPMLDAVITAPGMDLDTATQVQENIRRKHGGADNHGRRIIVLAGAGVVDKMEVKPLGMNATEMGFIQSFEQAAEFVLALFDVPKSVASMTDSSSYSNSYAAKQQFRENGLIPYFLRCSDFLTQALAEPWSEYPGEFKIEIEPPPLGDIEMEKGEREFALQNDAIDVNEYRAATGRKPKPNADVPLSVYRAILQQKFAPPPAPGMPGVPGGGQEAEGLPGGDGAEAPTGQAASVSGAQGDDAPDTPEGTQDAVMAAVMRSLGVPDDGAVAKALPARKRSEGEVWTSNGRNWTVKNGRTVPAPKQSAAGASKPSAAQVAAISQRVSKPGLGARSVPTPPRLPGAKPAFDRAAVHAKILKTPGAKAFGFTAETLAKMGEGAVKAIASQLGIIPPEQAFAEAAKAVPVATPVAKKTVLQVSTWAHARAVENADRVAAHFGIDRSAAIKLLVHAITETCRAASKSGSTNTTGVMDVGGKRLKVNVRGKVNPAPTGGAAPRPANPDAEGSRPPRVGKAMSACDGPAGGFLVAPTAAPGRRKKRVAGAALRALSKRVLKALEG